MKLPEGLHPPTCVRIELDSYTGPLDTDRDGRPDAVRLYMVSLDAQGRFVPTVGTLKVTLTTARPGAEAVTLATQTYEPKVYNAAYRSGITGAHYTVTLPIPLDKVPEGTQTLTLRVGLTDALTGGFHETQKPIP